MKKIKYYTVPNIKIKKISIIVSFYRSQWAHSELVYSLDLKLSSFCLKSGKSQNIPNIKRFLDLKSEYSNY